MIKRMRAALGLSAALLLLITVMLSGEDGPTVQAATYNVGTEAELATAINAANTTSGDMIVFSANIRLTAPLPAIDSSVTIDGAGFTLSGDANNNGINDPGDVRTLFVNSGDVYIRNLSLTLGRAAGASGSAPGGGGGAGMGGAL